MSKAVADARAETEYAEFAARRRALLEAESEREQFLEKVAEQLPERPKRNLS